ATDPTAKGSPVGRRRRLEPVRGVGTVGQRPPALLDLDVDLLDLGERLDRTLEGELASDAAGLVAAVGLADDLAAALVDLDPAGFDPVRGVQCVGQVVRPNVGAESVMRIVRHRYDLVTIPPRNGDQDGSEDFLTGDPPGVVDAGKNGRPGVKAVQSLTGEFGAIQRNGHARL